MSQQNETVGNGSDPSPTSTSAASSRSSSRTSSSQSALKVDDKTLAIIEEVANQVKAELIVHAQKEVESEMQQLLKEVRQHYEDRFKKNLITACASSLRQAELQQQKNNVNNKRKIRGLKNQVKHETEEEVVKAQQDQFSSEWQDVANDYTEHITDDLETELWEEMTSNLQNVYRFYRNTANSLKLDKQASVDLTYNRLESLLTKFRANNNEGVRCLTTTTEHYLRDEIKRRELDFQTKLELEARTLRRELAQISQDAARRKVSQSTTCLLL